MEGIFIRSRYVFVMESFACLLTFLALAPEISMLKKTINPLSQKRETPGPDWTVAKSKPQKQHWFRAGAYFRNQFQACLEIIVILIRIKIQTIKGDKYLKAFGLEINLEQSKESHVIKPTVVG